MPMVNWSSIIHILPLLVETILLLEQRLIVFQQGGKHEMAASLFDTHPLDLKLSYGQNLILLEDFGRRQRLILRPAKFLKELTLCSAQVDRSAKDITREKWTILLSHIFRMIPSAIVPSKFRCIPSAYLGYGTYLPMGSKSWGPHQYLSRKNPISQANSDANTDPTSNASQIM